MRIIKKKISREEGDDRGADGGEDGGVWVEERSQR